MSHPLRVLAVTYYYRPHVSGLTLHIAHLLERLAADGAEVTVLAGRHEPGLPDRELVGGVRVRRLRAVARVDKGIVLPALVPEAARRARRGDAVVVPVLPLGEAGAVAGLVPRRRLLPFYICDLRLAGRPLSRAVERAAAASARACVRRAPEVCASSAEYVRASRIVGGVARAVVEVPPPVAAHRFRPADPAPLRRRLGIPDGPVVGFVGRLVPEKGLPVLLEAMGRVRSRVPDAVLVVAGEGRAVAGGGLAAEVERAARDDPRVVATGFLPDADLPAFYSMCSALALPSVDPLEAYGMVQVEAMLCGTPVVASDMPGVRIPVGRTGMGRLAPPGDPVALADALVAVLGTDAGAWPSRRDVAEALGPERAHRAFRAAVERAAAR